MPRLSDEALALLRSEAQFNRKAGAHQFATALEALIQWQEQQPASYDLIDHLARQRAWSLETFGPGARTAGVIDHIRKELREIEAAPSDLEEWADLILLAFDGALRAAGEPAEIAHAIQEKLFKNQRRTWPDWKVMPKDKAIEHVRGEEEETA